MEGDSIIGHSDRRLLPGVGFSSEPPGVSSDPLEPVNKDVSPITKESRDPRTKSRRNPSRSKSPSRRRRRSSTASPERRRRRYEDRDPRTRGRRSRSRERPRSPPSRFDRTIRGRNRSISRDRNKSRSPNRYRNRRSRSNSRTRRWSPKKKGPVSPPMQQLPPQQFNVNPMQIYNDGYNYPPNMPSYGPNQYQYDYSVQVAPPIQQFNAYVPPPGMQPVPPGDDFQPTSWNIPHGSQQMHMQSAVKITMTESEEEKQKREAAVAQEKKNQRATLRKQREDYKRRSVALKGELVTLKEQRDDLLSGSEPPSPTTKGILKENDRLQSQIESKITTIENVIDMLSGIIGNEDTPSPPPIAPVAALPVDPPSNLPVKLKKKTPKSDDDSSPERLKSKVMESIKKNKEDPKHKGNIPDVKKERYATDIKVDQLITEDIHAKRINFVHYDPEMHWCKSCQVFPKTAKDYLTHLHSKQHRDMQKTVDSPWHEKPSYDEMPSYPDGQTKRTPIRGLQFFVPTTGWYCKLCSIWIGDLHCASLHLKSQTHANQYQDYISQNPHFEVDWMSDRQRAYENKRDNAEVPPPPPLIVPAPMPISELSTDLLDGIPLRIQVGTQKQAIVAVPIEPEDKKKKKKKKQDDRKEKKKKKRSKKRKHSSSSSSSSNTSDSEGDGSPDKKKEDANSHSIRVAMRNLKQQNEKKLQEESGGKWTVVQPAQVSAPAPPPPTISANGAEAVKKDDIMISQWNVPEPIISEKEKKLLEQLKGRLKKKSSDRDVVTGKSRYSRENSRERRRSRSRSRDRIERRNRRSRSRGGRRSKSRSRSRSPGRWSSRRRSRSRSRSRNRRIERPIVRYPEFRPRVPEKEKDKKKHSRHDDDNSEIKSDSKKTVLVLKKPAATTKKLPFIGRMPVFKKQSNDEEMKKEEQSMELNPSMYLPMTTAATMHGTAVSSYQYDGMHQMSAEDYDDLMPDPMQFVSLMGAPPPPPIVPPPEERVDKNEPVLPPGIDEADADLVIKPISDAPLPRKGPLPQDFQDALSIIFPGDKKPDITVPASTPECLGALVREPVIAQSHIDQQHPNLLQQSHEDQSQHGIDMYGAFSVVNGVPANQDMQFAEDVDIPNVVVNHVPPIPLQEDDAIPVPQEVPPESKSTRMDELNDLAMLGIDADDLAAQCM